MAASPGLGPSPRVSADSCHTSRAASKTTAIKWLSASGTSGTSGTEPQRSSKASSGKAQQDFAGAAILDELSTGLAHASHLLVTLRSQLADGDAGASDRLEDGRNSTNWHSTCRQNDDSLRSPLQLLSSVPSSPTSQSAASRVRSNMSFSQTLAPRGFLETAKRRETVLNMSEILDLAAPVDDPVLNSRSGMKVPLRVYMLEPSSGVRTAHDSMSLFALAFDLLAIPIQLAWDIEVDQFEWLRIVNLACISYWLLDIIMNFNTGVYLHGELVMKRSVVALRYIKTTFFVDVFLILVDFVAVGSRITVLLRVSKITRVARVMHVIRRASVWNAIGIIMESLPLQALDSFRGMGKPLFLIIIINHWLACAWFASGFHAPSDTGRHWLDDAIDVSTGTTYWQTNFWYQYTTCYHWSMTQMTPGSLQVHPQNTIERVVTVVCLLVGMITFSSIISSLAAKMSEHRNKKQEAERHFVELSKFLKVNDVDPNTVMMVERAVCDAMTKKSLKPRVLGDLVAVKNLPSSLQRLLRDELCKKHLQSAFFRLLAVLDSTGLTRLCQEAVEAVAYAKGDVVFAPNSASNCLRVVSQGSLTYTCEGSNRLSLDVGMYLCDPALWLQWVHMGEALAAAGSVMMNIDADKFGAIVLRDNVFGFFALEYGKAYCQWASRNSKLMSDATGLQYDAEGADTEVHFSMFEVLLPVMPLEFRVLVGTVAVFSEQSNRNFHQWLVHSDADDERLREEVLEGKALFFTDDRGALVRVVALQVIQLADDLGRVFMQMGSLKGDLIEANVKLPGAKQQGGEPAGDTVARILEEKLAPMANSITWEGTAVTVSRSTSKRTKLQTKYVKSLNYAMLKDNVELTLADFNVLTEPRELERRRSSLIGAAGGLRSSRSSFHAMSAMSLEFFAVADIQGDISFFAWLPVEDIEYYKSGEGEQQLQHFFDSAKLSPEVLVKARRLLEQHEVEVAGAGDPLADNSFEDGCQSAPHATEDVARYVV